MSGAPRAPNAAANTFPDVHHLAVARTARYYTVGGGTRTDGEPGPGTVWVALHGYGQLAEYFARNFVPPADGATTNGATTIGAAPVGARDPRRSHATDRLVIVPEALSRFYLPTPGGAVGGANGAARVGATWMTREDRLHEIGDYVRYLDGVLDAATAAAAVDLARTPLAVLGFSQGAATACRWAAHRHAAGLAPAARVVLWGGGVPHDIDLTGPPGDALRSAHLTLVVGDADEFATAAVTAEQETRLRDAAIAYEIVHYAGGHRLDAGTLGRVLDG